MTPRKKRVLLCNESSLMGTGFGVYGAEVLKRLHATGRYDLAELATYGDTSDPGDRRWRGLPWAYYPVHPHRDDAAGQEEYAAKVGNQFGEWLFEQTCLDFRPDVVVDVRDWWMLEYQERSPFRPFYRWLVMPTVDAAPQDEQWLATYASADGVFAYSDWGLRTLRSEGGGRIRTLGTAPPGADTEVLRPVADRAAHQRQLGLPPGSLVVGTVMRNQKRKLYPDLIASFARLLATAPRELAARCYLYLHVCYPDLGWEIPTLVKEAGVGGRTLFTYLCGHCGVSFPSFYQDAHAHCRACGRHEASLPSGRRGVSRAVLATVLNFMDVYVQYASSEGFGMPQVEAAACGVPVMAVDYSAMSDVVRKLGGTPVRVLALCRESETGCHRAVPDNDDFVAKLTALLALPDSVRRARGYAGRSAVLRHYTYGRTAAAWADAIDALDCPPHALTWGSPPRRHTPAWPPPDGLSDSDWVRWGMVHVAGRPDLADGHLALRMARDLAWGATLGNTPRSVFNEMSLLGHNASPATYLRQRDPAVAYHPSVRFAADELLHTARHRAAWDARRVALNNADSPGGESA